MSSEAMGREGSVTFTTMQANVWGWAMNVEGDTHNVTNFSDAGVERYKEGNRRCSGTINLSWSVLNTMVVPSSAALTLQEETGKTWQVQAILNSRGESVDGREGGTNETVATFQGTGALTYPT